MTSQPTPDAEPSPELVDNSNPETRDMVAELVAAVDTLILDTLGGLDV